MPYPSPGTLNRKNAFTSVHKDQYYGKTFRNTSSFLQLSMRFWILSMRFWILRFWILNAILDPSV